MWVGSCYLLFKLTWEFRVVVLWLMWVYYLAYARFWVWLLTGLLDA